VARDRARDEQPVPWLVDVDPECHPTGWSVDEDRAVTATQVAAVDVAVCHGSDVERRPGSDRDAFWAEVVRQRYRIRVGRAAAVTMRTAGITSARAIFRDIGASPDRRWSCPPDTESLSPV
jgi:hypothetical protein